MYLCCELINWQQTRLEKKEEKKEMSRRSSDGIKITSAQTGSSQLQTKLYHRFFFFFLLTGLQSILVDRLRKVSAGRCRKAPCKWSGQSNVTLLANWIPVEVSDCQYPWQQPGLVVHALHVGQFVRITHSAGQECVHTVTFFGGEKKPSS